MRIIWLKTELLHPVDKGGRIRTLEMLKRLKQWHHVTYFALEDPRASPEARNRASEYCNDLVCVPFAPTARYSLPFWQEAVGALFSTLPHFLLRYRSRPMREAIRHRLDSDKFDLLVCDFLQPHVNMPASTPCATLLFQHNIEAQIRRRQYEVQSNPLAKAYFWNEWRKAVAYEAAACRQFDQVVAVSVEDCQTMERDYGVKDALPVATGVDVDFFRPTGRQADPKTLVFTGSMDWLPNQDAIVHFVRDILPLVRRQVPEVRLTVVGRMPPPSIVELGLRDSGIVITGRVDDVRPYIEAGAVYVVPLRVGGGTRLKVFEAMAMERPVVSTTLGVEGLPLEPGADYLRADAPGEFAEAVVKLFTDESLAGQLARRAAQKVRERHGWEGVARDFSHICERTVQASAPAGARS